MMFSGFCISSGYTFLCVGFMHGLFPRGAEMATSCFRLSKPCREWASLSPQIQVGLSLARPGSPDCPCPPVLPPRKPDGLREGAERHPRETWGCHYQKEDGGRRQGGQSHQHPRQDGLQVADVRLAQASLPHWATGKKAPTVGPSGRPPFQVLGCARHGSGRDGDSSAALPCRQPGPLCPPPRHGLLILKSGLLVSASQPEGKKFTLKPEHSVVFPGKGESLFPPSFTTDLTAMYGALAINEGEELPT